MMENLMRRYPSLTSCKEDIVGATYRIIDLYKKGGKLLLCGNGGSCADCEHIVGELMKGFLLKRPISDVQKEEMKGKSPLLTDEVLQKLQLAVPAIALPGAAALNSAFCNDVDAELVYAQSLMGLGKAGDVLLCISTSGNSKNCVAAAEVAKGLGLTVVALTGAGGGKLSELADICIKAPETETYKVQELHLPIYHYICAEVEKYFFQE